MTTLEIEELIEYNITYSLDGGTNDSNNPTTYNIKTNDFALQEPTKKGYEFLGWTVGKNIFDINNLYTQGQWNGPNKTFYSSTAATINVDKDLNKIVISSTKSYIGYVSDYIKVQPNTTYTFSYNVDNRETNYWVGIVQYKLNKEATYAIEAHYRSAVSFTTGDDINYIKIAFETGDLGTDNEKTKTIIFNNIQVEEGNKVTSYEPYISAPTKSITIQKSSEGNRTYIANWSKKYTISYSLRGGSTTTNPLVYSEASDVTINNDSILSGYTFFGWVGGKNLMSSVFEQGTLNDDGTNNKESLINVRVRTEGYVEVKPNTTYWLTDNLNKDYEAFIFFFKDKTGTRITSSGWYKVPNSFTTPSNTNYIRVIFRKNNTDSISPSEFDKVQLEEGELTNYEKYSNTPQKSFKIPAGSTGNRTYKAVFGTNLNIDFSKFKSEECYPDANKAKIDYTNKTITLDTTVSTEVIGPAYITMQLASHASYLVSFDYQNNSNTNYFSFDWYPDSLMASRFSDFDGNNPGERVSGGQGYGLATTTKQTKLFYVEDTGESTGLSNWMPTACYEKVPGARLRFFDDVAPHLDNTITTISNITVYRVKD